MSAVAARPPQDNLNDYRSAAAIREELKVEEEQRGEFLEDVRERCKRRTKSDVRWMFKRLRVDPYFFFRFFWNIGLNKKQEEIANSWLTEDHTIGICSRQVGKTLTGAGTSVMKGTFQPNMKIGLYAPKYEQAVDVGYGYVKKLIYAQPVLEAVMSQVKHGHAFWNNGNEFKAQTANDRSNIRGYDPSGIWVDESPEISNETFDADIMGSGAGIAGITASGGYEDAVYTQVLQTGTPKGRNHFERDIRPVAVVDIPDWRYDYERPKRRPILGVDYPIPIPTIRSEARANVIYMPFWESHTVDLKFVEERRQQMPTRLFEQEFCCAFNADEGSAFNLKDIVRTCVIEQRDFKRDNEHGMYVGGVDLGRNQDHTVITILRCDRPRFEQTSQVLAYEFAIGEDWTPIAADIYQLMMYWKPRLTLFDQTGIGEPLYNIFFRRIPFPTEGFIYGSAAAKADIMHNLEVALQNDAIRLWDDEKQMRQLRDTPYKRNNNGVPIYPKPDGGKGHDDFVQSLALAVTARNRIMKTGDGRRQAAIWHSEHQKEFMAMLDAQKLPGNLGKKGMVTGRRKDGTTKRMRLGGERVNFSDVFQS